MLKMSKKYGEMEKMWNHSYKVAYYSHQIARNNKMISIIEEAYTAGILHDIGKIVVSHLHPDLIDKINTFCGKKGILGNFIENLAIGVTHSKIGSLLARKWSFSEKIIAPIEFHHQPLLSPDNLKDIVFTVYLANSMCAIEEKRMNYSMLEKDVLQHLSILSEKQFNEFHEKLKRMYSDQQEKFKNNNKDDK